LNCDYAVPKDASDVLDVDAAERRIQFHLGWLVEFISWQVFML